MSNFISEDQIEQALVQKLQHLHGFDALDCYTKNAEDLWKEEIKNLRGTIAHTANDVERQRLKQIVEYMKAAEMAVVVSEDADEDKKFASQGLDIKPHPARMNKLDGRGHDIEYNFKDAEDPLQLVFVCAMWLTGFDAQTLYLDKPMKGHTLMQTIARANRVTSWRINDVEKRNGEIVDYYNVFRNMKLALKDYAQGLTFCQEKGIPLDESVVVNDAEAFKARQYSAEYQITQKGRGWDLSKINFDKLREEFIDRYNSGGSSTENAYEELMKLTEDYDRVLFREKCDNVFHLMLDYASHGRKWAA